MHKKNMHRMQNFPIKDLMAERPTRFHGKGTDAAKQAGIDQACLDERGVCSFIRPFMPSDIPSDVSLPLGYREKIKWVLVVSPAIDDHVAFHLQGVSGKLLTSVHSPLHQPYDAEMALVFLSESQKKYICMHQRGHSGDRWVKGGQS